MQAEITTVHAKGRTEAVVTGSKRASATIKLEPRVAAVTGSKRASVTIIIQARSVNIRVRQGLRQGMTEATFDGLRQHVLFTCQASIGSQGKQRQTFYCLLTPVEAAVLKCFASGWQDLSGVLQVEDVERKPAF